MEFPRLVYRCPGPCQRAGGTFGHRSVGDASQFDAALADGWFATLPEAIDALTAPKVEAKVYSDGASAAGEGPLPGLSPAQQDAVENAPATRAELEQKARELGIKFDGRTSDKKLSDLIAATLEE